MLVVTPDLTLEAVEYYSPPLAAQEPAEAVLLTVGVLFLRQMEWGGGGGGRH